MTNEHESVETPNPESQEGRFAEGLQYPDPSLRDGSIALRRWEHGDLPLVEEASTDRLLLEGTTLPGEYNSRAGREFIERQWSRHAEGTGLSLAITSDGDAVGCATLIVRRPSTADLGYWLVERARGGGTGGRAVQLLVEWALRQPGIDAVEAFVADENVPSQKLLEHVGFERHGRQRHQVNNLDEDMRVYRRGKA